MAKTPRCVSELARIIERRGDQPFRHADVADLVSSGALAALTHEGMISRVGREGKRAVWQATPLALSRYALPMVIAEDGSREPLSRGDAVVLAVWRTVGRRPFRAPEISGVSVHSQTVHLQRRGLLERVAADVALWRLTEEGAEFAATLARQVQEAALPSPQEASA